MSTPSRATILSDTCSICHKSPKYRCPRCRARTCSLACTQRHKKLAVCSGVRDPVQYLSRPQIAAHPDRLRNDFHMLRNIERERDNASQLLSIGVPRAPLAPGEDRSTELENSASDRFSRRLARALHDRNIKVLRAPLGMSRRNRNRTEWVVERGCISWTVEWIQQPKSAVRYGQALDCWDARRNFNWSPESKQAPRPNDLSVGETIPTELVSTAAAQSEGTERLNENSPIDASLHFYLQLVPQPANAPRRVLYLRSGRALSECFRSRTMNEFPTIYVLEDPPETIDGKKWALDNPPPPLK